MRSPRSGRPTLQRKNSPSSLVKVKPLRLETRLISTRGCPESSRHSASAKCKICVHMSCAQPSMLLCARPASNGTPDLLPPRDEAVFRYFEAYYKKNFDLDPSNLPEDKMRLMHATATIYWQPTLPSCTICFPTSKNSLVACLKLNTGFSWTSRARRCGHPERRHRRLIRYPAPTDMTLLAAGPPSSSRLPIRSIRIKTS